MAENQARRTLTVAVAGQRTMWVDVAELVCPGCRDQVHPEPPTGQPGVPWSHRDGSSLCGSTDDGSADGPVERIGWPEAQR